MKFSIILLLSVCLITSCKKNKVINPVTETETSEVLLNSDIDSTFLYGRVSYKIIPGLRTVFKYDYTYRNSEIDDGFSHSTYAFGINLPPSQNSFVLTDDLIKNAPGFYAATAAGGPTQIFFLIPKGKITGSKISNSIWQVTIHFEFSNSTIDDTKNFIIK